MAEFLDTVNAGTAAQFRTQINDNFSILENENHYIYVGNDETTANDIVANGGFWLETD